MKITRRQTFLGAASVSLGLPTVSQAALIHHPLSPLLPMTQDKTPNLLRTRFASNLGTSSDIAYALDIPSPSDIAAYYSQYKAPYFTVDLEVCPISHGRSVGSVFEAEDILLNAIPVTSEYVLREPEPTSRWHYAGDSCIEPFIAINRQCNLISSRTYRAAGNVILMNEATFHKLMTFNSKWVVPSQQEKIGRWTKCSIFNGVVPIYTSDHMPDMEVVTLYRGNIATIGDKVAYDVGALLIDRGQEGLLLIDDVFRPDLNGNPNHHAPYPVSSALCYFARVRFVNFKS